MLEALVPLAGKKLAGYMASRFSAAVIERWSRYRSEEFLRAFCEAVIQDEHQKTEKTLNDLLESELKGEALFDAYRAVALSRTKSIGPRAIGYLTARAINEGRTLTDWEAAWGEFFQTASDVEILQANAFFSKYIPHTVDTTEVRRNGGNLEITWSEDNSVSPSGTPLEQTFNLHHIGTFAPRLNNLGIISGSVVQHLRTVQDFVETGVEVSIRYQVTIRASDVEFIGIIDRALRQS